MKHIKNNLSNLRKRITRFEISNVMKKILISFLISVFIFSAQSSLAVANLTSTPTTTTLQEQVNELKTKIASKVASLNLVEKRGILGTVTDASDTQITLQNVNGQPRYVDVDELTQFFSSGSNSFGISDVKKGMFISVLGLYNKESERTQAREVDQLDPLPNFIYGAVSVLDKTNYTLTVAKENGTQNLIDVETITTTYAYSDGQLSKSGYSKIILGEPLIVIGYFDKQNKNEIVASRIILFPKIGTNPNINLNKAQALITPSTGSGKILTPIVK